MMVYQSAIPTNRVGQSLTKEQELAALRAERGSKLTSQQRGSLRAAEVFADPKHARRAAAALEADRRKWGKR
jgi:hypothetical protein